MAVEHSPALAMFVECFTYLPHGINCSDASYQKKYIMDTLKTQFRTNFRRNLSGALSDIIHELHYSSCPAGDKMRFLVLFAFIFVIAKVSRQAVFASSDLSGIY